MEDRGECPEGNLSPRFGRIQKPERVIKFVAGVRGILQDRSGELLPGAAGSVGAQGGRRDTE